MLDASSTRSRRSRTASTRQPKLERQLAAAGARASTATRSTGRSPRRSRSGRCCSKARPVRARRPGHAARHVQPAPRVLVDQPTSTSTRRSSTSSDDAAPFMIYDSVLSEFAALGFEYGYSVADPTRSCAGRRSSATSPTARRRSSTSSSSPPKTSGASTAASSLLLPHGFEGQGPEHSSARLERFLVAVRRATTCASCTRPPPRSTSTCCAARCTPRTASR